jgi:hypothetical protein
MNNFGIVDTITTANVMAEMAESMGIAPADRFNTGSSMKVKGNPLSSNVHRVYELRCTKAEAGKGSVKTLFPIIVGKLFPLGRQLRKSTHSQRCIMHYGLVCHSCMALFAIDGRKR